MSIRVKRSSGHYDVAQTEAAVNQIAAAYDAQQLECVVQFLDDSTDTFFVDKRAFGQALYDQVFDYLEVLDRDYFGLQFFDTQLTENAVFTQPIANGRYLTWLDALAPIRKQVPMDVSANGTRPAEIARQYSSSRRGSVSQCTLLFRVKYYPSDPARLHDEYTRFQLFLQLRKDLLDGRLAVTFQQGTLLASYALQSELGDYHSAEHGDGSDYVAKYRFVPSQSREFETETARLHRLHRGQSPADAELNFLNRSKQLDFYGVRLYAAHIAGRSASEASRPVQLGVNGAGVGVFSSTNVRLDTIVWTRILRLSYHKSQLHLLLRGAASKSASSSSPATSQSQSQSTEQVFVFANSRVAKHFWKSAIEQHGFFRLHKLPAEIVSTLQRTAAPGVTSLFGRIGSFRSSSDMTGSVGSLSSSFRYSTRTEFQTLEDSQRRARTDRSFVRGTSGRSRSGARSGYGPAAPSNLRRMQTTVGTQSQSQVPASSSASASVSVPVTVNRPSTTFVHGAANSGPYPAPAAHSQSLSSTPFQTPTHAIFGYESPTVAAPGFGNREVHSGDQQPDAAHLRGVNPMYWSASNSRDHLNGADRMSNSAEQIGNSASPYAMQNSGSASLSENESDAPRVTVAVDDAKVGELANAVSQLIGQQTRALLDRSSNGIGDGNGNGNGLANSNDASARGSKLAQRSDSNQSAKSPVHSQQYDSGKSLSVEPPRAPWLTRLAQSVDQQQQQQQQPNESTPTQDDTSAALMTVRLRPDSMGRYGFNVKGGVDQHMPIVVSKIAAGMAADTTEPRLHEGDQLISLNGCDVQHAQHAQVVATIRQLGQAGRELSIVVRPTVYYLKPSELLFIASINAPQQAASTVSASASASATDDESEVSLCEVDVLRLSSSSVLRPASTLTVPGARSLSPSPFTVVNLEQFGAGASVNLFELSLGYLRQSLASGAILQQFERLHRRKPGYSVHVANLPANASKNRYRDVQPYDETRIVLNAAPGSGSDYINASYVNLDVPNTGIVMRYVATQGPLPTTVADFWEMVWQTHATLVVMLTSLIERGRSKCARYWPDVSQTASFGRLECTCVREFPVKFSGSVAYAVREMILADASTHEERPITQLHFDRWPDHSVPENLDDFVRFLFAAREHRHGSIAPVVVHCSAGIGRTGVFIFLETLVTLVENEQPLNLLYFIHLMRTQRALLIQNRAQFEFCCSLILRLIDEGLLKSGQPARLSTSVAAMQRLSAPAAAAGSQSQAQAQTQVINPNHRVAGNVGTEVAYTTKQAARPVSERSARYAGPAASVEPHFDVQMTSPSALNNNNNKRVAS